MGIFGKKSDNNKPQVKEINIITICGNGLGSSLMLAQNIKKLCEESNGKYHVVRDDDLCQTVEAVPEPTAEETAAQSAEQELQDFDTQIRELKDRMTIAQLCGNTELIAELQQEYAALMTINA